MGGLARHTRLTLAAAAAAIAMAAASAVAEAAVPPATPRAKCGPGSKPEPGMQGRVPKSDVDSGKALNGYHCNIDQIGHEGKSGGFKVLRYVDKAGHECAYYDTTLLFPLNAQNLGDQATGTAVVDMSNPSKPVRTTTLVTPAMQSPHESVNISTKRGILAAVLGNPGAAPGQVDVYDLNKDCRHPALQASLPVGFLGHESGFAPDGRTFYATSLFDGHVTAVDLTNPKLPTQITSFQSRSHGMNVSDDGKRGYIAALGGGLQIMDLTDIQVRAPNPQVHEVSRYAFPNMTIPQNAIPVTIKGHKYAVEVDEFSTDKEGGPFPAKTGKFAGVARVIDIADEKKPHVVSEMRLQVHQPENRAKVAGDYGTQSNIQGYAGHYCNVPQRKDPGIVACSFILSGLRVFDIRDPKKPKEIAYFVAPMGPSPVLAEPTNYAMSSPSFAPARGEIWYSDGNSGFYALRVRKGVWPFGGGGGSTQCLRSRSKLFRLHRDPDERVVKVVAYVNGERKLTREGHDVKTIRLRHLPRKGRMTIRIVTTHNTRDRLVSVRTWRGCKKGKLHLRHIRP